MLLAKAQAVAAVALIVAVPLGIGCGIYASHADSTGGPANAARPAPTVLAQGVEHVVPEDAVIDFDSGRVLSLPADVQWEGDDLGPRLKWTKAGGGDVWVHTAGNPLVPGRVNDLGGLFGSDMKLIEVDSNVWDQATPAGVKQQLQDVPHLVNQSMRPIGKFPQTYLFRTRDGASGILQLTHFQEDPRAAAVRYKLVEHGPQ